MLEPSKLYHTSLESGIRCLSILESVHPAGLDINQLVALDHIVVHSSDFDALGPLSLHPASPYRRAEPVIRREVVQSGLRLITGRGLAIQLHTQNGFLYIASEEASPFLSSLTSNYWKNLLNRTHWAGSKFKNMPWEELSDIMTSRVDNWVREFSDLDQPIHGDS
jgi:hypothetical protein